MNVPAAISWGRALERAQVSRAKQARARDAILRERFSATRIRGIWLLRLPPGADFRLQLRRAGVPQRLMALVGAHFSMFCGFWRGGWWDRTH
jgi:ATP-binding cassette subfamily B protein